MWPMAMEPGRVGRLHASSNRNSEGLALTTGSEMSAITFLGETANCNTLRDSWRIGMEMIVATALVTVVTGHARPVWHAAASGLCFAPKCCCPPYPVNLPDLFSACTVGLCHL